MVRQRRRTGRNRSYYSKRKLRRPTTPWHYKSHPNFSVKKEEKLVPEVRRPKNDDWSEEIARAKRELHRAHIERGL